MDIAGLESYVPNPSDIGPDLVLICKLKENHPWSGHG
jgi:hypothetical protein